MGKIDCVTLNKKQQGMLNRLFSFIPMGFVQGKTSFLVPFKDSLFERLISIVNEEDKTVIVRIDHDSFDLREIGKVGRNILKIYGKSSCADEDTFIEGVGIQLAKLKFLRKLIQYLKCVYNDRMIATQKFMQTFFTDADTSIKEISDLIEIRQSISVG